MKKVISVKMVPEKTIADQVLALQDKDAMLRRSLERLIQLYTDKSHFVYELLQNAEDAGASRISFLQYEDRLEVLHDGLPFTRENLQGLCDIGLSDKTDDLNQIGEFGVGFKSVFGICETVRLYSHPNSKQLQRGYKRFSIEIRDFTRPETIEDEEFDLAFTTRFVFPYCTEYSFSGFDSVEKLQTVLSDRLEHIGVTTLLFMKNLQRIDYQIDINGNLSSGEYSLEKEKVNDHCMLVSAKGQETRREEDASFLVFSRPINTSQEHRSVDIAFALTIDEEGIYQFKPTNHPYISVYFPTETESKLKFIVQGPYRTTPNRSSVPYDNEDNIKLAKETASLLHDSVVELCSIGQLNLSLVNILPVKESLFDNAPLFKVLYEETKDMLSTERLLPCKAGHCSAAMNVKIARGNKFAEVLTDDLLTELLDDGIDYYWLPTELTETSKEYADLYSFLTNDLGVGVLRPEGLQEAFNSNDSFLKRRDDQWLKEMYDMYSSVANAFSKSGGAKSMLLAKIIKTTKGDFVAPYRRVTEGRSSSFLPTVYLPVDDMTGLDHIAFVDEALLRTCVDFFRDVVGIEKPDTYELFISDYRKRCEEGTVYEDVEQSVSDLIKLHYYGGFHNYSAEVSQLVEKYVVLRCKRYGAVEYVNPSKKKVLFPTTDDGSNVELYCKNVISYPFVDLDFYESNGITRGLLTWLGVEQDLTIGKDLTTGDYSQKKGKHTWKWYTRGDFRWMLTIESLEQVLYYISKHPDAPDSMAKSSYIFRFLVSNEDHLTGTLYVSNNSRYHNSYSEIVRLIRREEESNLGAHSWNGKWLYTQDGVLVSQKEISKYDLNTQLYGEVDPLSGIYEYLAFSKSNEEEYEEAGKEYDKLDTDTKNKYFEIELQRRFGMSSKDLENQFSSGELRTDNLLDPNQYALYEFPTVKVRNWDNLRKHVEEVLSFASPVVYAYKVRHLRISRRDNEVAAYLKSMYKYDNSYKCACQMCHEPVPSIEKCQISKKMDIELDAMYLGLCPTCASEYRRLRENDVTGEEFIRKIATLRQQEIDSSNPVKVPIGNEEIWFTQTHIAEINELLKLQKEADEYVEPSTNESLDLEADESTGLDIFKQFVGQRVEHTTFGRGIVKECDGKRIVIAFDEGQKAGETGTYSVQTCWANDLIHVI